MIIRSFFFSFLSSSFSFALQTNTYWRKIAGASHMNARWIFNGPGKWNGYRLATNVVSPQSFAATPNAVATDVWDWVGFFLCCCCCCSVSVGISVWCVSAECRSLFLSFFHLCHCICRCFVCLWLYLQAMCCAAYRRRTYMSGYETRVCVCIGQYRCDSSSQATNDGCERNRARLNVSCRFAEKSLCDASQFYCDAHTVTQTLTHYTRTDECGKRSHKRMDFFESHSLTAIICS